MTPPRVIALDWSGARLAGQQRQKIWLAEAVGGRLVRLEAGRTRDEIARHLAHEARRDPALVVGIDFAFSFPAWYLRERGIARAHQLWAMAASEGERWLGCQPPFWGRRGVRRPEGVEQFRRTEREATSVRGVRPKSAFQVSGAGTVGTASVRGMPMLLKLHQAGYAVWPFDAPRLPLAVEIYPRLLTGPVTKSSAACRIARLRELPGVASELGALAASSDDAFDAAVSAVVMSEQAGSFAALAPAADDDERLEGRIWAPAAADGNGEAGTGDDERGRERDAGSGEQADHSPAALAAGD